MYSSFLTSWNLSKFFIPFRNKNFISVDNFAIYVFSELLWGRNSFWKKVTLSSFLDFAAFWQNVPNRLIELRFCASREAFSEKKSKERSIISNFVEFERILSSLWLDKFDKFVPFSFYWSKRNTFKKKKFSLHVARSFRQSWQLCFSRVETFFCEKQFLWTNCNFFKLLWILRGKFVDFQRKLSSRIAKTVFFMSRGVVAGKQVQWKLFSFWWPFGFWANFFFWRKFPEIFSQLHSTCSHKRFH